MSARMLMKAKRGRIVALLRWSEGQSRVKPKKTKENLFIDTQEYEPASNVVMFRHTPVRQQEGLRKAS